MAIFCGCILGIGVPNGMENGVFQVGQAGGFQPDRRPEHQRYRGERHLQHGLRTGMRAGNAIGLALITVVGQCVGARAIREAQTNVKKLMFFTYGCMLVLNVFLFFLAAPVVALFDLSELATTISIDLLKHTRCSTASSGPCRSPLPTRCARRATRNIPCGRPSVPWCSSAWA